MFSEPEAKRNLATWDTTEALTILSHHTEGLMSLTGGAQKVSKRIPTLIH